MLIKILPEWASFILTMVFVLIAHELGFKFGTRRRNSPGENPVTAAGAMSGTTLGLLAFMLAFTFNGASSNHDIRANLVLEDANAIRTAYQRSMGLPEPERAAAHALFREYVDIRLDLAKTRGAGLGQAMERTSAIQKELWSMAVLLEQKGPNPAMATLFMTSLNEVFNVHMKRLTTFLENRISSIVWYVLFFLTFVTMAMMGYRNGLDGERSIFVELAFGLAFSSVLFLIIALDRPIGIMGYNQQPLINVQMMLR
jgi:hypothetical protein